MSRPARIYSESKIYHIMFRGINRQDLFEEREDYLKLIEIINIIKKEMGFRLHAYCLMTNHVHLLLEEKEHKDVSLIMKRILTRYSMWYNVKYERTGALVSNRYRSIPVEIDEYFLNLIRYIHQNPIKAGIVKEISQYKYSSYGEYINGTIISDTDFVLGMINLDEFREFHQIPEEKNFEIIYGKRRTDEDLIFEIKTVYCLDDPKEISRLDKEKRNAIIRQLKEDYPERLIQRITGVSRSVIAKL